MKKALGLVIIGSLISGCASAPDEIRASSVSPLKYKDYNCNQIIQEMSFVNEETTKLYTTLDKKSSDDNVAMGVGLVLFWPALFFLEGGDGPAAAEYAQLKGEYKALNRAAIRKNCDVDAFPPSPEALIEEQAKAKKKAAEESNDASDI